MPYRAGPDDDPVVLRIGAARLPPEVLKWLVVGLCGVGFGAATILAALLLLLRPES